MGPRTASLSAVETNSNINMGESKTDNESFCVIMAEDSNDAFALTAFESKAIAGRSDGPTSRLPPLVASEDVTPVSVHYLKSALSDLKRRLNLKEDKNLILERQIHELQQQLNFAMSRLSESGNGNGYNGVFQDDAVVSSGAGAAQEAVTPQSRDGQDSRAYIAYLSQNLDVQKGHNRTLEAEIVALRQHNEELSLKLKQSLLDLERVKSDNCKGNGDMIVDLQGRLSALMSQLLVKNKELEEKTRLLANTKACSVTVSSSQDLQNYGLSLHAVPGGTLPTREVMPSSNDDHVQSIGHLSSAEQQRIDDEVEKCRENFRHLQQEVDKQSVIARYIEACSSMSNILDDDNASISSVSSADEASSALSSDFFFMEHQTPSSNILERENARPIDPYTNQHLQTNKGVDEITYGVNAIHVEGERTVPIKRLDVMGQHVVRGGGNETFSQGSSTKIADFYGRVEPNLNPVDPYAGIQHLGMTKNTVERTLSTQADTRPSPVSPVTSRSRPGSDFLQLGALGQNCIDVPSCSSQRFNSQIPQTNVASQCAVDQPAYVNQHAPQQPIRVNQSENLLDNRISGIHDARYQILRNRSPLQPAVNMNNAPILRPSPHTAVPHSPIQSRQPIQRFIGPLTRPTEPPRQHTMMPQQPGRPTTLSASTAALSPSLSLLALQRQDVLAPQVCPICKQDFTLLSMGDFQTHVFDCYDNEDADGHQPSTLLAVPLPESEDTRKVCPMCTNRFPLETSQDEFERHVNGHFEEFEVINMPST